MPLKEAVEGLSFFNLRPLTLDPTTSWPPVDHRGQFFLRAMKLRKSIASSIPMGPGKLFAFSLQCYYLEAMDHHGALSC